MNAALRLSIKQWAPQDRPSDKLQNLGAEQMSDAELISLLVGCGTAQQSAVDVANNILRKFGNNLNALGKARFDELEDIEGVGVQTACKIMAAVELGRRRQMAAAEPKPDMGTAVRIYNYSSEDLQLYVSKDARPADGGVSYPADESELPADKVGTYQPGRYYRDVCRHPRDDARGGAVECHDSCSSA